MKRIEFFQTKDGKIPFENWYNHLDDATGYRINAYIKRLAIGGSKNNIRALGDKVFELKINYGPGLRVYFGESGDLLIIILIGGNKGTQKRDIKIAKKYWRDFYV